MAKKVSTTWMWQEGSYTRGVNLEIDKGRLAWLEDLVGFGCALAPIHQPLDDFIQNGPGRYASPPEDILTEMHEAIAVLTQ